jgi:hypothetical protein
VLLDELVFKDGGLFLAGRDDGLEVADDAPEERDEVARVAPALLEVAPHA